MRTDCFYVYDDQPVRIAGLLPDGTATIHFIQRTKGRIELIVPQSALQELTPELLQKMRLKYNRMLTQCNLRLHAFAECERYMD